MEVKTIRDDQIMVSQITFDSFRNDPKNMLSVASNTPPNDMLRRIKRDATLFPTLKDEKYNYSWHRSFGNQESAQDVSKVLDWTPIMFQLQQVN
jgi:hypothetical protein